MDFCVAYDVRRYLNWLYSLVVFAILKNNDVEVGGFYFQMNDQIAKILTNIDEVMIGKREVATLSLVALLAEGHILLEDVPGVGKTMMVRTLAKSIGTSFNRIQFTPDLLPSDVVGVSIYNPKTLEFEFREGPIVGHIVLADEINRTSPKTQSALLEAMEEGTVTVDGETVHIPKPFFVMATQNPIEYEGTYSLPEAQLDRFLFKIQMGYPTFDEEVEVLRRAAHREPLKTLQSVMTIEELRALQQQVKTVHIEDSVKAYIVDIVRQTRSDQHVYLGASPRASIALMRASQSYAFMQGRSYVLPDDVQYLAKFVLSHRLILKQEARYEQIEAEEIVQRVVTRVAVPTQKAMNYE